MNISTISPTKAHLLYWIVPGLLILCFMLIYFLDILGMSFVVSPELNREFGLLEHLQSLTILGICVIACAQILKAPEDFTKYFFIATGIFSLVVFLEEIDYFIHYYELISSNTIAENSTGSFEREAPEYPQSR